MVDKPYFRKLYETRGVEYLQLNLFVLKADDFISYQRGYAPVDGVQFKMSPRKAFRSSATPKALLCRYTLYQSHAGVQQFSAGQIEA